MTDQDPVPEGSARAIGGLLGVLAAEAWRGCQPGERFGAEGPVSAAMVDLSHSYVAHWGDVLPVDVGHRRNSLEVPAR